jgi:DNA-binding transcriptional regulator YdaS (Cro superfamily)
LECCNREFAESFGVAHPALLKFVEDLHEEAKRKLRDAEDARGGFVMRGTRREEIEWPEILEDFEDFQVPVSRKKR